MPSRTEAAEYLMALAYEMSALAKKHRFELASQLFEMAHLNLLQEVEVAKLPDSKSA